MELTYRKAVQLDAIQVLYIALVLLFVLTGITPPFSTRIKYNKDGIVLLQRRPTGEHDREQTIAQTEQYCFTTCSA